MTPIKPATFAGFFIASRADMKTLILCLAIAGLSACASTMEIGKMNTSKKLSSVAFHDSGLHNRAYFRSLEHTKAGKQIDAMTGLAALQMAGRRVIGNTYNVGRNESKRVKAQLRKLAA